MAPPDKKDEPEHYWARDWEFGDSHFSSHQFVEAATQRAPKELGCAFAASFLVSPLVSIIDKSIVQAGQTGLMKAMGAQTREMIL